VEKIRKPVGYMQRNMKPVSLFTSSAANFKTAVKGVTSGTLNLQHKKLHQHDMTLHCSNEICSLQT